MSMHLYDARDPWQWRCGICLFMLPAGLATIEDDYPPHGESNCASENFRGVHQSLLSGLLRSIHRGCDVCTAIASMTGLALDQATDSTALQWWRGKLQISPNNDAQSRIFVGSGNEPATPGLRDIHPWLNEGIYPSGDTSSAQAFDKMRARMQHCLTSHRQCAALGDFGPMPVRILYIESSAASVVRLIDDTSSMDPQPYACLSHRWTEQTKPSSLTRDRVAGFRDRIPEDLLYPLLRDACVAAERMGVRYIWIDCLCICQDDLDDWNHQASAMSAIYENAAFTISALDAQLNGGRLFAKDAPDKARELCRRGGQTVMVAALIREHPFFVDTVGSKYRASIAPEKFPLLTRGWVYQERLLARRIVHFTRGELIWECREAMACECGRGDEAAWALVKRQSPRLADMAWGGICAEYTKTELSVDADRLPALSGVARRYGEARGWTTYLAGVWREDPDLPALLLWFNAREEQVRPRVPGLPSWSWASVRAANFFPVFPGQGLMRFRVVGHELVPGPVPYSTPETAKLVVEGPCIPVSISFKPGSYDNPVLNFRGDDTAHNCFSDFVKHEATKSRVEQSSELIYLLCLQDQDGPCGLLLKPLGLQKDTYERIGMFSYWGTGEDLPCETRRIALV